MIQMTGKPDGGQGDGGGAAKHATKNTDGQQYFCGVVTA